VVRGTVRVSPPTRERVERSLAQLGYRPNLSARHLRQGRTGVIALAVPALDAAYFSALARATITAAAGHGWTVLIDQTDGQVEREVDIMAGEGSHLVDGVVLSPLGLGAAELEGRRPTVPIVLLGERVFAGPDDHVAIDNVRAAREATSHLLGLGRHRIAAVGAQQLASAGTARLRLQGWREAHEQAGVAIAPELIAAVESFDRRSGADAAERLLSLDRPPDGLFCFNDQLALGAMRTLALRGVRVPDDVAVVGFDDIEDGAFSVPSLTTVRPDLDSLAREALDLLSRRIGGTDTGPPQEVTVGHSLVVRESTVGRG